MYITASTGQITWGNDQRFNCWNVVHESFGGQPLCGTPLRDWQSGVKVAFARQGPGAVTCQRCERIHNREVAAA